MAQSVHMVNPAIWFPNASLYTDVTGTLAFGPGAMGSTLRWHGLLVRWLITRDDELIFFPRTLRWTVSAIFHKILHDLSFFFHTCDSCSSCIFVMLASLRKSSPFIHTKPYCRKPSPTTMQNWSHLLALAPGESVFSRHFASYFFSISSLFGMSFP